MPDVAAEAGRSADQHLQEQKRSLMSSLQREAANRYRKAEERSADAKKDGSGDLAPQESSAIGERDNIDADSSFESQDHAFEAEELDPEFEREAREINGNEAREEAPENDTFEGQDQALEPDTEFEEEIENVSEESPSRERSGREERTENEEAPAERVENTEISEEQVTDGEVLETEDPDRDEERIIDRDERKADDASPDRGETYVEEPGSEAGASQEELVEDVDAPVREEHESRTDPEKPELTEDHSEINIQAEDQNLASTQETYHDIKDLADAGPEGREDVERQIGERLRDNTNTLLDGVKDGSKDSAEKIDGLKNEINSIWEKAGNTQEKIREGVEKSREAITRFAEKNPQLMEALKRVMLRSLNPVWLAHPNLRNLVNAYDILSNATNINIPESLETMKGNYESISGELQSRGMIDASDRPLSEKIGEILDKPEFAEDRESLMNMQNYAKEVEDAYGGLDKALTGETPEDREEGIQQFKDANTRFGDHAAADIERAGGNGLEKEEKAFADSKDWIRERYDTLSKGTEQAKNAGKGAKAADAALKQAEGVQKVREAGRKAAEAIKKAVKVSGEAMVKSGVSGILGAAAFSNPWTAIAYVAVQITIKTIKFGLSKAQGKQREVDNALSTEKGSGAKSQAMSGRNMSKRDTKAAEALERF